MTTPPFHWSVFAASGILLGIGTVSLVHQLRPRAAALAPSPADTTRTASDALPTLSTKTDPAAAALYQRSLAAEREVIITARVSATRWNDSKAAPFVFDLIEDTGNRYRMTYVSPKAVAGRVLVSNGKTLFQYEPTRNLILKRPAPIQSQATEEQVPPTTRCSFALGDAPETVAGRPVTLVTRRAVPGGVTREKRWVDAETGRTLRHEQFDAKGVLERRVEFKNVSFPGAVADETFAPDFPIHTRVLSAAVRSLPADDITKRYNLPMRANRFTLRTVLASPAHSSLTSSISGHQLLYSDGRESLSVFVVPTRDAEQLRPSAGWVLLPNERQPLMTRSDRRTDGTAVAWIRDNRWYIAVSRMPLQTMLPIVRALVHPR